MRVYVLLSIGLLSISFSPILVRFATEGPGLAIAVWRTAFAALILLPFALRPAALRRLAPLRKKVISSIVTAAVFLALHFILWIESLYHTSVASASVLVSTTPIFLGVLGYIILKERLSRGVIGAIVLGVGGAGLIAAGDAGSAMEGSSNLGNALALSASIAAAVYLLIGRVVRQGLDWLSYVAPLYLLVALVVIAVALVRGTVLLGYDPSFYLLCFLMALGPQVFGHGSFNYALRYMSPTLISLLILLEPVVSSVVAYFLFAELPGPLATGGMVLVLVSVATAVIVSRSQR